MVSVVETNKPMPRRMRKLLIVIVVLFSTVFVLSGAFNNRISALLLPIIGDSLDRQSKRLMGKRGLDCGRVKVQSDPKAATVCALNAQAARIPFRVRYDIMGYDSAVSGGIVRSPDGRLDALSFDGDPSGQGGTSLFGERV